jgi:hypothetical protein
VKEDCVIYLTKRMKTNGCIVVTEGTFDMETLERLSREPDTRQTGNHQNIGFSKTRRGYRRASEVSKGRGGEPLPNVIVFIISF